MRVPMGKRQRCVLLLLHHHEFREQSRPWDPRSIPTFNFPMFGYDGHSGLPIGRSVFEAQS
jgi:hypothetical protein